ncbi:MAG: ABC transporter permease [Pseudomonadota bacterium]
MKAAPSFAWIVGLALTAALTLAILVSFAWTPYDPTALDIGHALSPPSAAHWLGTDQLGRDLASVLLAGARNSVAVALTAVAIGLGLGAPFGLASAAAGGWIDDAIMRINDIAFAFPALLLAVLLSAVLGPGWFNAALAIGVFNVPVFARLTRGEALALWGRDFILAARAAGKNRLQISIEHVAPNLAHQVLVQAAIQFSLGVLAEAGLSYVGLGVQPPAPSWGRTLSESQTYAFLAPWLAIAPGAAILFTVLGLNLLGDGLRQRFDRRETTDAIADV